MDKEELSVDFSLLEEHDWFEIERDSYNPQGCNGLCVIGNRKIKVLF